MDLVIQETLEEILIRHVSSLVLVVLLIGQLALFRIEEHVDGHSSQKPEYGSQYGDQ